MKVFQLKIDRGRSGNEEPDEIYASGFSFTGPELSKDLCTGHVAEVESNGLPRHFLPYGSGAICVHESAIIELGELLLASDLVALNLPSEERAKFPDPFNEGAWYGIRPSQIVELDKSAKVTYFTGPGVKAKVFREVKSYVFQKVCLENVSLFWIVSHGTDCFVTDRFEAAYRKAGLSGLKFVDTKCTFAKEA